MAVSNSPVNVTAYVASSSPYIASAAVFAAELTRLGGAGATNGSRVTAGSLLPVAVTVVNAKGVPLDDGRRGFAVTPGAFADNHLTCSCFLADAPPLVYSGLGQYALAYAITKAGVYSVSVYDYVTNSVLGTGVFPVTILVVAGAADRLYSSVNAASLVNVTGSLTAGTAAVVAGTPFSFALVAADTYTNAISYGGVPTDAFALSVVSVASQRLCRAVSAAGLDADCATLSLASGASSWSATGLATVADAYTVSVTLTPVGGSASNIVNSPFTLTVTPALSISVNRSYIADSSNFFNGLYSGTAGTLGTFYVYSNDAYGNRIAPSALVCTVSLSGAAAVNASCAALASGSALVATYVALVAGTYTPSVRVGFSAASQVAITNGIGSLTIAAGALSAANCSITFNSMTAATFFAGGNATFKAYDGAGNALGSSSGGVGVPFTASATPTTQAARISGAAAIPQDNLDGTYTLRLVTPAAVATFSPSTLYLPGPAAYSVAIRYAGIDIAGSPFAITVSAAATDPTAVVLFQAQLPWYGGDGTVRPLPDVVNAVAGDWTTVMAQVGMPVWDSPPTP